MRCVKEWRRGNLLSLIHGRKKYSIHVALALYCWNVALGCPCFMGLLPDTQNCGCACAGNAGNVFPVAAGKRSRHASRHVRYARAVMHAGIAKKQFPSKSAAGENVPGIPGACATCHFAYLVRGPCGNAFTTTLWRPPRLDALKSALKSKQSPCSKTHQNMTLDLTKISCPRQVINKACVLHAPTWSMVWYSKAWW